jgi:glucose-1-phosphate adenylyltransferase
MDYARMLADHVESGAPCTVACIEVSRDDARDFGVIAIDERRRVTGFVEKPADPPALPHDPDRSLASMGIYVFTADYLYEALRQDMEAPDSSHDFGKDVLPRAVAAGEVFAHPFELSCVFNGPGRTHYWRDVGTVDAYWEANIDLTATTPELNLYDRDWPIWTFQEQLPPAKFVHNTGDRRGMATESTVSGGCIISGALNRSLLFSSCRVHSYAKVESSVLLPQVEIGRHARLTRTIVDHRCRIPDGLVVGEDPELDGKRFRRTEAGVCLITQPMTDALDL